MAIDIHDLAGAPAPPQPTPRVLYVAWQRPDRRIVPVGRLTVTPGDGFEYRYLASAEAVMGRPFASFPDFDRTYRSERLFPFFGNRMVPRERSDYADWAAAADLGADADPFEVLAATGGQRATDTLEVFAPPTVDRAQGTASVRFLVRGVRYCGEEAQDAIDRMSPGQRLTLRAQPDNPVDPLALVVIPGTETPVGWIPGYLCPAFHRAVGEPGDFSRVVITVRHVGDRSGPSHFRLLCDAIWPWTFPEDPFDTEAFALSLEPSP